MPVSDFRLFRPGAEWFVSFAPASSASKERGRETLSTPANNLLPSGLAFNPSAWSARWPILVLALGGFCIASYLAAFQLGVMPAVWDPIFGQGSRTVLHSFLSRLLPVPDAVLGAAGYLAEIVTGAIGGKERWRELPWLVLVYGVILLLAAITAFGLTMIQAFVIQAGCLLCLCSAAISLGIAWLARNEVRASLRFVREGAQPETL